jgi:hypothetical protein
VGFEPAIPAIDRPQPHALDSAAIGIGSSFSFAYITTFSFIYQQKFKKKKLNKLVTHAGTGFPVRPF